MNGRQMFAAVALVLLAVLGPTVAVTLIADHRNQACVTAIDGYRDVLRTQALTAGLTPIGRPRTTNVADLTATIKVNETECRG